MLKKNHTHLQDHEDRNRDAVDVLRRLRLCFKESQKTGEWLWSELEEARKDVGKKERALLENHQLMERMQARNDGLRENLITLTEEFDAFKESAKMTKMQSADLQRRVNELTEELLLAQEKSSEVDKFLEENKEEKTKLLNRCDELESEVRLQAERARKVPPEVIKKIKEDYLTSEEFWDEKIECTIDGYFWGFDECVRQVQRLDPNFDTASLKRGDTLEEEEDSEVEK